MSLQAKLDKAKKRIKELEGEIAGQKQDPDKKDENKDDGKTCNQTAKPSFFIYFQL